MHEVKTTTIPDQRPENWYYVVVAHDQGNVVLVYTRKEWECCDDTSMYEVIKYVEENSEPLAHRLAESYAEIHSMILV